MMPPTTITAAIEATAELVRLALTSPDPTIARFARAFFEANGREAFKMVADIQRHAAYRRLQVPKRGAEPFNLSDAELEAEWRDL